MIVWSDQPPGVVHKRQTWLRLMFWQPEWMSPSDWSVLSWFSPLLNSRRLLIQPFHPMISMISPSILFLRIFPIIFWLWVLSAKPNHALELNFLNLSYHDRLTPLSLIASNIAAKLTNQYTRTGLSTPDWQQLFTWLWWWFHSGCRNISHHYWQQSIAGLHPRRRFLVELIWHKQ